MTSWNKRIKDSPTRGCPACKRQSVPEITIALVNVLTIKMSNQISKYQRNININVLTIKISTQKLLNCDWVNKQDFLWFYRVQVVHIGGKSKIEQERNLSPWRSFNRLRISDFSHLESLLEIMFGCSLTAPSVIPWPGGNFIERMLRAAMIISCISFVAKKQWLILQTLSARVGSSRDPVWRKDILVKSKRSWKTILLMEYEVGRKKQI